MQRIFPALSLLLLVGMFLLTGQIASAHSELIAVSPPIGSRISGPLPEIRLTFDELLQPGSTFTVYNSDFVVIPAVVQIEPAGQESLVWTEPTFPETGQMTIQWVSVNSDGHMLTGSFSFEIEEGAVTEMSETNQTSSVGETDMQALMTVAEGATSFNPPGWVAWLMIALAFGTAIAFRMMMRK